MERISKSSAKSSKGFFKRSKKFAVEKASKRKIKVSLFENTNHNKRYQQHVQRKRNMEKEMDKIKVKIGDETFVFQSDGSWQNSKDIQEPITNNMLKLKKNYEKLESVNSKLKLSYEIVLNMLVSKNHQIEKLESELKKLRGIISKPSILFPDSESTEEH